MNNNVIFNFNFYILSYNMTPVYPTFIIAQNVSKNQIFIQEIASSFKGLDDNIRFLYQKRAIELMEHLISLKSKNIIDDSVVDEILLQFSILELHRHELISHKGKIVVVCNGELFFGENLSETVKKVKTKHGNKPHYSETIDMIDYHYVYD